jgi:hydrogenase expression/formation protein HypC
MFLAVPGKVLSVAGEGIARVGRVNFGGIVKEVNLAYVPQAGIGDYVVVHVGFAISVMDAREATQVFEYLKRIGELRELEEQA